MGNAAKILPFKPREEVVSKPVRTNRLKNTDGIKYYTKLQIQLLRRTVRDQAVVSATKGNKTQIKEWMVIDLITSTGLRVSEAANLRCGDIKSGYGQSAVYVRDGKGGKSRTIQAPESMKRHLNSYLTWKRTQDEATGVDDYVFVGQRGPWTAQAIQQIIKKYLKALNLYESGKSVHALRHSYAVELYRKDKDLRAVQKQLGHSSVQTTTIYADVLDEDIEKQIKNMWGM